MFRCSVASRRFEMKKGADGNLQAINYKVTETG